jgi:hypothetical protein
MTSRRSVSLLLAAWVGLTAPLAAGVPVIYCTDLFHPHDDPDDHFDLASIYALHELDLKGIVLDQGAKQQQKPGSIPVSQLNRIADRKVPAVLGLARSLASPTDKALDQAAEYQGGVALILKTLRESPGPVRIAAVGSVRDVVAAFNREPALFRAKVDRLLVFIGEASDPKFREYNVELDPHAYVGLMRSGLPVWWVPCFDGGLWQNRGHASFWKASHREVLQGVSPSLMQYFIYALEHEKADPLQFLAQPVDAVRKDRLLAGERNFWCTVIFSVLAWPTSQTGEDLFGFVPVEVTIGDDAALRYGSGPGAQKMMRFEIRDRARYAAEMTQRTARLLQSLGTTQGQTRSGSLHP